MSVSQGTGEGGGPAVEGLLDEVIRRLWPVHRVIVRAVERGLAGTGMTAGQHAVLDALRRGGPRTVPQLARALDLDRQPVQRLVNDAKALGLAETVANPEHRRSSLVRLTVRGESLLARVQGAEREALRRHLGDLDPGEVATALRVLDRLGEVFQELERAAGERNRRDRNDPDDRGTEGP
ncbi:MarR family winged helix-turn-helix transcriptional regulator [Kitasatospora sp. NPDC057692]|uniref:MarR family winged helix-turn-helix transcriptional regulator n=1 Tax=Kitasatospora sp. NPDC057692 TaxID=3346215 RepID=UPI0036D05222